LSQINKENLLFTFSIGTIFIWAALSLGGCNIKNDCVDCGGGLLDGYLYKVVSTDDLASVPDLDIESCIRFKYTVLTNDEIDSETVTVVNDCCCKEYSIE